MENSKGIVYIVTSKTTNKSYIGLTTKSLNCRKKKHKSNINTLNTHFYSAIKKYGWQDFTWRVLYKDIPLEKLAVAEICAIYTYDSLYGGYNSTIGGDILYHTEEIRDKISSSLTGRKLSEKHRKRLSESKIGKISPNKGKKMSDEQKNKISQKLTGRKLSDKTKAKISKRLIGHSVSCDTREKISMGHTGKRVSGETKKKMSESHKGQKSWSKGKTGIYSEETIRKMNVAKSGKKRKPFSQETRERMSKAAKLREEKKRRTK